ncbi:MAG: hypothetical protein [Bacteriophage sp.]|nr:MAG: hypothetical protein [Bacteriophage sp.]
MIMDNFPYKLKNLDKYKEYFIRNESYGDYSWLHKYICSMLYGHEDMTLFLKEDQGSSDVEDGDPPEFIEIYIKTMAIRVAFMSASIFHMSYYRLDKLNLSSRDNLYCKFYIISKCICLSVDSGKSDVVENAIKNVIDTDIKPVVDSKKDITETLPLPIYTDKMLRISFESGIFAYDDPYVFTTKNDEILKHLIYQGLYGDNKISIH